MADNENKEWRFLYANPLKRGSKTLVMGIVNMTPDSFSGQNAASMADNAVELALAMLAEGADIIDIGAESSRPGALPISAEEETSRLGDVVAQLRRRTGNPISVDTYHPETAYRALNQGADIINDITALRGGWDKSSLASRKMGKLVADTGAHVVLMHMPCPPQDMTGKTAYPHGVVRDVVSFLSERIRFANDLGIEKEKIWLDPGFGFGKDFAQNRELLLRLGEIKIDDLPLLAGLSRKRMVGDALGADSNDRLEGSLALAVVAAMNGAEIIRVHDVKETAKALTMLDALRPL